MRTNTHLAVLSLALAGLAALPAAAQFTPMATAVPDSVPSGMNYQGRLEKDGFPVTANKAMAFRLYNVASGGTALYDSGPLTVAVAQGIFAVSLDIPFGALTGTAQKYLELEVDGIVLAPRDPLRSVPYAKVAETVEGTINISTAGLTFTTNVGDSLAISSGSGRVGIGTASPAARLHVSSGAGEGGVIVLVSTGASTLATVDGNGVVTANSFVGDGTTLRNVVRRSGDSMSGSLTLNASTLTVGGSGFSVAGTEFWVASGRTGVGTATPLATLSVVGDSSFSQPATFLSSVTVASSAQFGSGATRSTFSTTGALALDTKARLSVGTTFYVDNGSVLIAAAAGSTYALRLNGDLLIGNVDAHDLTSGSDIHVEGNVILDGRLIQHGTTGTSLDNLAVVGAATFKSSATFVGAVGIGGTLGVAGTTTLTSSVTALGAASVGGNLGLGTTSPASKLTVIGDIGATGAATFGSSVTVRNAAAFGTAAGTIVSAAGAFAVTSGQNVTLAGGGNVLGLPASPAATGAASKEYVDSQVLGGLSGWVRDTPNTEVELANSGDEVGIGTASPLAKLHVVGDMSVTLPATFASSVTVRQAASFGTSGQSSFNAAGALTLGTPLATGQGGTGNVNGTIGALTANGANCAAGSAPEGVDATGAAEGCADVALQTELDAHAALTNPHSATSANTASRIVLRDASGNFTAGTITAALTGNAATATRLAANGGNCGAGNAPLGVDDQGLTEGCFDVATQAELDAHAALTNPHSATDANTASRIVMRDASGNFSAGTITMGAATVTGVVTAASMALASGKLTSAGTDPTISACGTTPTFVGSDTAGKITIGTGATTSCTVTFSAAYSAAPACAVTGSATGPNIAATTTTTVLTITSSADMASNVVMYVCVGL